jgi:hypothetical protein
MNKTDVGIAIQQFQSMQHSRKPQSMNSKSYLCQIYIANVRCTSSSNLANKQPLQTTTTTNNNTYKQQHLQTTTPTNNNTYKQQHLQTTTPTSNNNDKKQHQQTTTLTNTNQVTN